MSALDGSEEYSAKECIEYAISCLRNNDSRGCTIKWLECALAQMPSPCEHDYQDTGDWLGEDKVFRCSKCEDEKWVKS